MKYDNLSNYWKGRISSYIAERRPDGPPGLARAEKFETDEEIQFLTREQGYVREINLSINELIYPIASVVRRLGCYPLGSLEYCDGERLVWGPAVVREENGLFSVFNCSLLDTRESDDTSRGYRKDLPPSDAVRLYLISEPFDFYGHETFRFTHEPDRW
ncbi:MAG TPA: hypothetical protein DDW52_04970 [Planctomycetaceae bacterium]|nr:hypothetical protein [Planctomycetaceae bacterium]